MELSEIAAIFLKRRSALCILVSLLCFCSYGDSSRTHQIDEAPSDAFYDYYHFTPNIFSENQRSKRSVHTKTNNGHLEELSVMIDAFGKDFVVDLQINRDLLPKHHFEKYQSEGKYITHQPYSSNDGHCYYKGHLQGVSESWAAISTCKGINGVIFDGKELYYIQPMLTLNSSSGNHVIYKRSDLKPQNLTCGFDNKLKQDFYFPSLLKRHRRSTQIHGPYNSNSKSRYVELVLVNDNILYKRMNEDNEAVIARSKDIANIVNALFAPLNIFIALVGVVVWSNNDEITLSESGDITLTNFLRYRQLRLVQEHPNDNAQLITGISFRGGVVGKALKGPICTYEYSGGVNMDHNPAVGLVATTVAHELGHNFGMEHDNDDCGCPEEKCIMAPASSHTSPTQWSSCSQEYLRSAFDHGMDYCLRNRPTTLLGPVCGNGFVEEGEECDCGLKKFCDNRCCNASFCTLYANSSCATGSCCDLQTCQIKPAATLCRGEADECDLPEFCNGKSEYCPNDVYKQDGIPCKGSRAYCFQGQCNTHTDQCRLLWGPSGQMSDKLCFDHNSKGNALGNCGYFQVNKTYKSCLPEDSLCGMLHCTHLNERLEFGMESVAILSRSFITEGDQVLTCRSAIVDLGLNSIDPGLAPNGAKCGVDKVCVNQRCLPVSSLMQHSCPNDCGNRGICNSNGRCHCHIGYEPPNCDYPGSGGSLDSGPASDPNATNHLATAMYIIFLVIVPMLAASAFVFYYYREHIKTWWITKAREKAISRRAQNAYQRRMRLPAKSLQEAANNLEISQPMSTGNTAATISVGKPTTPSSLDIMPTLQTPSTAILPSCNSNLQRTHSVKAAKLNLDRNSLRNLEISNPIPQTHGTVSTSVVRALPIRPAPPKPNSSPQITSGKGSVEGNVGVRFHQHNADRPRPPSWTSNVPGRPAPGIPSVTRAASMNEGGPNAGSVRLKRLSSGSFRPTNPPPCPPPLRGINVGRKLPEISPTEQTYESVIYSEPDVEFCQKFEKGRLQFMEEEHPRPPPGNVNKNNNTALSTKSNVANSKPSKFPTYNSDVYSEIKSTGPKLPANHPSGIGAKVNNNNRACGAGSKFSGSTVGTKLPTGSAAASKCTNSKLEEKNRTNGVSAAPLQAAGGNSVVGNLAKRFECQLSSDSTSSSSSKPQAKDSFRSGNSFRQNKPSLPPKSLGSATSNSTKQS